MGVATEVVGRNNNRNEGTRGCTTINPRTTATNALSPHAHRLTRVSRHRSIFGGPRRFLRVPPARPACPLLSSALIYAARPGAGGRARSGADAMRSTPTRCAAGNRARRFVAPTSVIVIRVAQPHGRRTCAPGTCRTHAPLSRRACGRVRAASGFPACGAAAASDLARPPEPRRRPNTETLEFKRLVRAALSIGPLLVGHDRIPHPGSRIPEVIIDVASASDLARPPNYV